MLTKSNRLLAMEILHRLELQQSVSIEELTCLHHLAKENPEVKQWLEKLLQEDQLILPESNFPSTLRAA